MLEKVVAAITAAARLGGLTMSKRSKQQHDLLAKRVVGRATSDFARAVGEALRRQVIADAKTLGPNSITLANQKRIKWGLTLGGLRFPASVASPTIKDLGAFVRALGLEMPACFGRTARYASGPLADFMALAESVKERRPSKRVPKYLGAARARTWRPHVELPERTFETLEAMRFDDPRSALMASRKALKDAAGPVSTGRILAIHASNLRECDELAEALLALRVAIPALDVAGDAWGMGRALTTAAMLSRAVGRFNLARGLIDDAEAWYLRVGSAEGRSATQAFRGVLLLNASEPHAALHELDASLALLLPASRLYVAGVHQVRSVALLHCGDIAGSRAAISQALATVPDVRVLRGHIAWQAGNVETEAGAHGEAESLYQQAFRLIADPLCDRLLIAAQAVRAAVCQGETARALTMVEAMFGPMFEHLTAPAPDPTQRILRLAQLEVYRATLHAGLSTAILDNAIGRIEAARIAQRRCIQRQVSG
jgi:hypothetical protein